MWENLLSMNATSGGGGSSSASDAYIVGIANDIEAKIPEPFDVIALRKERGIDISPATVVLFQELERFSLLIIKISETLGNLKKALNGEIGMNAELDDLSYSLLNGFLPASWRKLAPQTQKKLGSWMIHFQRRLK